MIGSQNHNLNKLNISDGNTTVACGCLSSNAGYSISVVFDNVGL